ncbi:DUF6196 family protein [Spirillospora sp. CA-128828]|uniref:DUF6196 family protein n=1 Tax=Spirillospora sp. CA-128828 TaxID=3240033 RepID=UPI003D92CD8F
MFEESPIDQPPALTSDTLAMVRDDQGWSRLVPLPLKIDLLDEAIAVVEALRAGCPDLKSARGDGRSSLQMLHKAARLNA